MATTKPKTKTKSVKKTTTTKVKTNKKSSSSGGPTHKKRMYANLLRRSLTLPEGMLWKRLKPGFAGESWASQAIIRGFIADFFCERKRIVIEIDSSFHNGREDYDQKRDEIMREHGIVILRVQATEVMKNISAVLAKIKSLVEKTPDNLWEQKIK
jgi:very-short-patch-repair endonuclease